MSGLVAIILDEGKWLPACLSAAFLGSCLLLLRNRHAAIPSRRLVLAAMTLFVGVMISGMAFGHLLAVTTKLATHTLHGSLLKFYAIGAALACPAFWLVVHTRSILADEGHGHRTLTLHAWMALTLLVLGIHNLPLAALGLLCAGYHLHSRPAVGWAILAAAALVSVGLLTGSIIFMLSGQSFEQFSSTP